MPDWSSIADRLEDASVSVSSVSVPVPVSGGDISAAWQLRTAEGQLFVKTGPSSASDVFAAEAEGLTEIAKAQAVRVPEVIAFGGVEDGAFIALEWLHLESSDAVVDSLLGEQLAVLHETTRDRFGWHRDNTIGLTPQTNRRNPDWIEFFAEQRLGFQLKLAADNGHTGALQERGSQLLRRLPIYFDDTGSVVPSLLHGDLWSGNRACCNGQPVVFDPAVYYGDREADIAMTRLFGGFGDAFYEAYENHWPRLDGFHERQCLYQLYHVLNHLNLFGSSYMGRAMSLMDEVL